MYKIIGADGKEYGPVPAEQIRQWIAQGRVNADTRLQSEEGGEWKRAAEFPEFASETAAAPLPPPRPGTVPLLTPQQAAEQVNGPAIGLIVVAILNFLTAGILLTFNVLGTSLIRNLPQDTSAMFSGTLNMISNVVGLLLSGLILYGGMQMKRLGSYGLAMTASILAALPCISPCCIVGLPIGIWAIVALSKPEVKNAFSS